MSKDTIMGVIANYLLNTKWYRRLADTLLICLICLVYGIVRGTIPIPTFTYQPTVEHAHIQSEEVRTVLNEVQHKYNPSITANILFHNGLKSLDGTFSFIKFSLSEYVSKPFISINPIDFKDVPYSIHLDMISAFMKHECYVTHIGTTHPFYFQYTRINTKYILACPMYNKQHNLNAFILLGFDSMPSFDINDIKPYARRIETLL